MSTWRTFGWTGGNSTAVAAASAIAMGAVDGIDLSSGLSLGGGVRTDFQSNISINTWNTAIHWAISTEETGNVDYCSPNHLWPISPIALDFTGDEDDCVINGDTQVMADGTPHAARGIGIRFTHGFGVKCAPVQIWGTTAGANYCSGVTDPDGCYIAIVDLTSSNPEWATSRPGNKMTLKPHGVEAEEHWWNLGISVAPLEVGHDGDNCVKFECTYY